MQYWKNVFKYVIYGRTVITHLLQFILNLPTQIHLLLYNKNKKIFTSLSYGMRNMVKLNRLKLTLRGTNWIQLFTSISDTLITISY